MAADTLELRNIGPIKSAKVQFGDLTVLVGPQATGKSIFLEFLKLLIDRPSVFHMMGMQGLEWEGWEDLFSLYFGEGMSGIWKPDSELRWHGKPVDIARFANRRDAFSISLLMEKCFFIPAQRVLTLSRDGWLRTFSDYKPGDPYVVRDFSEKVRLLMESRDAVPHAERQIDGEIRRLLNETVLAGLRLKAEKGRQKRLVLGGATFGSGLPFMVWSAGQREFVPLLLGLYYAMPWKMPRIAASQTTMSRHLDWIVIEELEMGLHPKAISATLLAVLELLSRGHRLCLSTHSPHVLDVVWALQMLRQHGAKPARVLDLFDAKHTRSLLKVAEAALKADMKVYYFDPESKTARDISALDPGADVAAEAGWGGLTEFSGRVADQVARVVAEAR